MTQYMRQHVWGFKVVFVSGASIWGHQGSGEIWGFQD